MEITRSEIGSSCARSRFFIRTEIGMGVRMDRWLRHSLRTCAAAPALAVGLGMGTTAAADFIVCNDSFDVVNIAFGQDMDASLGTRGWWTVGPNRCVTMIRGRLNSRYFYLFATDVFGQPLLEGSSELCIEQTRFEIIGTEACWERGHIAAPFAEIDIGGAAVWTVYLGDASD